MWRGLYDKRQIEVNKHLNKAIILVALFFLLVMTVKNHSKIYIFLLLFPCLTFAKTTTNLANNWSIGAIITDFNYQEHYDTGQLANEESGYLKGISLGYSSENNRYFYQLKADHLSNKIDYKGFYPDSNNALVSKTDEAITDISGKIGLQKLLLPYLLINQRIWRRDINSTPQATGLNEVYRWLSLGVGIQPKLTDSLSLNISYLKNYQSTIKVTPKSEFYQPIKFNLGDGFGAEIAIHWKIKKFDIMPFYQLWQVRESDKYTVYRPDGSVFGSIFEPKSTTKIIGIKVNWYF